MPTKVRRSDATRATILAAARKRFAADGFERATIRAIAAEAGIDASMVMRYYGNKDGLFAAAADFDLRLPDVGDLPPDRLGSTLVTHFLNRWEGDGTLLALLRGAVTNEVAAQRMRDIFGAQVAVATARFVTDPGEATRRAGLVSSQMLGFALCRYVLRFPSVVALTREEAVAALGPTVQRYLTDPL